MDENTRPAAEQDAAGQDAAEQDAAVTTRRFNAKNVIVLVIVALFAGLVFGKLVTGDGSTASAPAPNVAPAGTTITSVRNDAVADYEAALKTGRPIYVLFHSLS